MYCVRAPIVLLKQSLSRFAFNPLSALEKATKDCSNVVPHFLLPPFFLISPEMQFFIFFLSLPSFPFALISSFDFLFAVDVGAWGVPEQVRLNVPHNSGSSSSLSKVVGQLSGGGGGDDGIEYFVQSECVQPWTVKGEEEEESEKKGGKKRISSQRKVS